METNDAGHLGVDRVRGETHSPTIHSSLFQECTNDVLTGSPTLADLGVPRLIEFELAGGRIARQRSMMTYYQEMYGDFPTPALPLRSPPLYATRRMPAIATQTSAFNVV